MKLRHAAALALTGWYLMVPPLIDSSGIANQEPLSKWTILGTFDSGEDCESGRIEEMTRRESQDESQTKDQSLLAIEKARCVESTARDLTGR
jgi:hypothetical protein